MFFLYAFVEYTLLLCSVKKIYRDAILNISHTNPLDSKFLFEYYTNISSPSAEAGEIIFLKPLLEERKNESILPELAQKPAMWSEVYAAKEELEIFMQLFHSALEEKRKIHIVGVTLGEEIQMLEAYYESLGFMREDINAFDVDFSVPLVTVSCYIENLMWRGSDYKAQRDKIFFNPPIRESGQNKALFKGITRGVIAGIELGDFTNEKREFIRNCILTEKILPLHMGKVLKYNLKQRGFNGEVGELQIEYT